MVLGMGCFLSQIAGEAFGFVRTCRSERRNIILNLLMTVPYLSRKLAAFGNGLFILSSIIDYRIHINDYKYLFVCREHLQFGLYGKLGCAKAWYDGRQKV